MTMKDQGVMQSLGIDFALPEHVAIIMDGNGRWAAAHGLPRALGHRAGMERLHEIVRVSSDIGLRALTVYAFSTENWRRPKDEVSALMGLLIEYFNKEIDELDRKGVCIRQLGIPDGFSAQVINAIRSAEQRTQNNTGLKFNIALNYGGRAEITDAFKKLARQVIDNNLSIEDITPESISDNLYTSGLADPDVIIRTSGEMRLSNFLLYQAAYSEFVFCGEHWPDFSNERYIAALREYAKRQRRYGGV